jgi:cysteine desulfurase/selenocysteine lyase
MTTAAARPRTVETGGFDVERARLDFPILQTAVDGKPLAFLDNAATSQKPESVIQAVDRYYRTQNANIHRGVYRLSQTATERVARDRLRQGNDGSVELGRPGDGPKHDRFWR